MSAAGAGVLVVPVSKAEFTDLGETVDSQNAWSSFKPYRDTTTRYRESFDIGTGDDDSLVSDIPELTRTQEVALRRLGRSLDPLEESVELTSFQDNWTPSVEIGGLDEPDSPRKRVSWPSQDELASTLKSNRGSTRDSTEIIPEEVRKQTPRATGYTNKVMMFQSAEPALAGAKEVNVGNIQTNLGQTTRGMLRELNMAIDPVDQTIPKAVDNSQFRLQSVPDMDEPSPPKPQVSLARTMRAELRRMDHAIDADQTIPKVVDGSQGPTLDDHVSTFIRQLEMDEIRDKKITPCLPKCLAFAAGVAILLAAIIAAAVLLKGDGDSGKHGSILPPVEVPRECPDVYVRLGDVIEFVCEFVEGHEARQDITLARAVAVVTPNRVNAVFTATRNGNQYTWVVHGPSTTCSSQGQYQLRFLDSNNNELHSSRVSLFIKASEVQTSIKQAADNNTEFDVTCVVSRDCRNYDVSFIGTRNNKTVTLNGNKECISSYSDAEGYMIQCSNSFKGTDTDFKGDYPMCRASKGTIIRTSTFELPFCKPLEGCERNCSNTDDTDACNSTETRNCFSPSLPIFNHDQTDDCMLGWCREPSGIVNTSLTVREALCIQ